MQKRALRFDGWAVLVLLVAATLRLVYLGDVPSCLEYDEAANVILAGEIAEGPYHPIFIRSYTGKEVLYFYLAAGMMKFAGVSPFVLRLTSAGLGMLHVALTYFLGREMSRLGRIDDRRTRWLALFSAALVAVSYWQVHLSRFGYRAILLPPLLALTVGSLLRGLRTDRWLWLVCAGASAGLSAYTYSSVRIFPLLLALIWTWVLVADRHRWRLRLRQVCLFGLVAAAVFAPLGIFFLRHPETFSVRLSQVSVFSPAVNNGDPWGTLGKTLALAFGMLTHLGDMNPLYNAPGKPVFEGGMALVFLLGLLGCAWRLLAPRENWAGSAPLARFPCFVLLTWLLAMMVPNVLSASGVPHNLRAMALVPAPFILAALGLILLGRWTRQLVVAAAGRLVRRGKHLRLAPSPFRRLGIAFLLALLAIEGGRTYYDYVHVWAGSAAPYYKGNQALLQAAGLVDAHPEADPYVATYFQQHATMAVATSNYERIRWMGGRTLVLPPPGRAPALLIYDHTTPVDPLLRQRYLGPETLFHREFGPDGGIAFEAYWLDIAPGKESASATARAAFPARANLGNTLAFLGYDLNAPPTSGGVLDVTLHFEVLHESDRDDLTMFVHLVGDLGFRWAEETFFNYPSAQWRRGERLLFRQQMDIAAGAPPGPYTLQVGVFSPSLDARLPVLNEAGQMSGTVVSAGPIDVAHAIAPPEKRPPMQQAIGIRVGDEIVLLGTDRDRSDLRPGETLALTLYWQATERVDQAHTVSAWLSAEAGNWQLWKGPPAQGGYPFAEWQAGEFVRDRYALRLPLDIPAGDFDLRLALLDQAGTPLVADTGAPWISLGQIHLHETSRLWEAPEVEHGVGAVLGDRVELLGYDLDPEQVGPGDTLHLTLVWRCRDTMDVGYTVFTHLLDQDEHIWGQKDNPPVRGTYPTTLWMPGEIIVDAYDIPVAENASPGTFVIEVGMYDPATMQRLPMSDPTGAVGDRILLAQVEVRERR